MNSNRKLDSSFYYRTNSSTSSFSNKVSKLNFKNDLQNLKEEKEEFINQVESSSEDEELANLKSNSEDESKQAKKLEEKILANKQSKKDKKFERV